MSGNSRFQLLPGTLLSILSQVGMETLFSIPIHNSKMWQHYFSYSFPIPKVGNTVFHSHSQYKLNKKYTLGVLLEKKVGLMRLYQDMVSDLLKKDNLFKFNTKHEFVQLDRLNIVLNVKAAFQNSQLYSQFFLERDAGNHVFIPILNSKSFELDYSFPFLINKFGNQIFHSHYQSQKL